MDEYITAFAEIFAIIPFLYLKKYEVNERPLNFEPFVNKLFPTAYTWVGLSFKNQLNKSII